MPEQRLAEAGPGGGPWRSVALDDLLLDRLVALLDFVRIHRRFAGRGILGPVLLAGVAVATATS